MSNDNNSQTSQNISKTNTEVTSSVASIENPCSNSSDTDPTSWVGQYGDRMYRFAMLQVRNEQLAEDLVQDTFLKAVKSLDSFRGEGTIAAWLFQILRNEIANYFRKQKSRKRRFDKFNEGDTSLSLDDLLVCKHKDLPFACSLEQKEFWDHIQECYQNVPPHLLETFLIRLANPEEPIESICQFAGISVSNFSVRLFRTRLLLRKCIENKL